MFMEEKEPNFIFPPKQNVSLFVIQTHAEWNFVALKTECSGRKIWICTTAHGGEPHNPINAALKIPVRSISSC